MSSSIMLCAGVNSLTVNMAHVERCTSVVCGCRRQHGVHGCNARFDVRNSQHGNTGQTGGLRPAPAEEVRL